MENLENKKLNIVLLSVENQPEIKITISVNNKTKILSHAQAYNSNKVDIFFISEIDNSFAKFHIKKLFKKRFNKVWTHGDWFLANEDIRKEMCQFLENLIKEITSNNSQIKEDVRRDYNYSIEFIGE